MSTPVLRLSGTSRAGTPAKNANASTWHSVQARWSIFSTGRLGGFRGARAVLDRRVGVRGDAPVAFLADGDGQDDELLGLGVERAGGQRGVMEFLVARVYLRDRVPQLARGNPQLVANRLPVTHLGTGHRTNMYREQASTITNACTVRSFPVTGSSQRPSCP